MLTAKQIPTTGRSTHYLCRQLGFASVEAFAHSLPDNATVVDVGAGVSELGKNVVTIRSDITWINADPFYKEFKKDSGFKLHEYPEDIVKPSSRLSRHVGDVDLVISYWLLPHLSLTGTDQARLALINMAALLKPDGQLAVGPIRSKGFGLLSPWRYKGVATYKKLELSKEAIDEVVQITRLWWLPRKIQLFSNKHDIHLLKLFVGGKIKK